MEARRKSHRMGRRRTNRLLIRNLSGPCGDTQGWVQPALHRCPQCRTEVWHKRGSAEASIVRKTAMRLEDKQSYQLARRGICEILAFAARLCTRGCKHPRRPDRFTSKRRKPNALPVQSVPQSFWRHSIEHVHLQTKQNQMSRVPESRHEQREERYV